MSHDRPRTPAPTPEELYELLCKLTLAAQIDAVLLRAGLPRDRIAAAPASVMQRASDIVELGRQGGPALLAKLHGAIRAEAPWVVETSIAPAPSAPVYENAAVRAIAEQLDAERRRRDALWEAGANTVELDRRILGLRRQLREGGRLRAGDTLGEGRYLLLDLLGRGGFASVWHALDRTRGDRVAIKVLHPEQAGDPTCKERFFRGAKVMAELGHEAVVRVLEPGADDGGHCYFVMELAAGGDLHRAVVKGRVRPQQAMPILLAIGDVLAAAHARGMVHRDVKPANILLDGSGAPRLTDFDLVMMGTTTGGTKTGAAMGSFLFMAPEQAQNAKEADARADVYGLGMTALFCLHGADLPAITVRRPERVIAALAVGPRLKDVLMQAIEIDPADRFADAGQACAALREASKESPSAPAARAGVSPVAGSAWREPVTGMSLVWVPPEAFLMGSSKYRGARGFDDGTWPDETPAHEVELPHGVWMGEHPVTNADYARFLEETQHEKPHAWQVRKYNAPAQPVVTVTFDDALAFCAWLTTRAGLHQGHVFDLPTEAEWEHAARGSDARKYPWGPDVPTPERACFGLPADSGAPVPVGERPAGKSPFGCHDMAGNIYEWCLDAWHDSYRDASKVVNPCERGLRGAPRVIRGGSWNSYPRHLRCAARNWREPGYRGDYLGFRVVCRGSRQPWLIEP
jgi:formylglycine-generating enzyme required for sulfatase activity